MNTDHLKALCVYFNLGNVVESPTRVHGDLLHIMWKVKTDKSSYSYKANFK